MAFVFGAHSSGTPRTPSVRGAAGLPTTDTDARPNRPPAASGRQAPHLAPGCLPFARRNLPSPERCTNASSAKASGRFLECLPDCLIRDGLYDLPFPPAVGQQLNRPMLPALGGAPSQGDQNRSPGSPAWVGPAGRGHSVRAASPCFCQVLAEVADRLGTDLPDLSDRGICLALGRKEQDAGPGRGLVGSLPEQVPQILLLLFRQADDVFRGSSHRVSPISRIREGGYPTKPPWPSTSFPKGESR
jgi:hypothetical protein